MIAKIRGGLTCQYLKFAIIVSFKVIEMSLTEAALNESVFREVVSKSMIAKIRGGLTCQHLKFPQNNFIQS